MTRKLKTLAVAAVAASMSALPLIGQSVEEVLNKHYDAIGGTDGWTSLQTMKATGTLNVMGGMMEGPFSIVQQRPAKARIEMTIQGMTIVQAYDGTTAWQIMPLMGSSEPQVADAETAQQIIEQADLDGPLIGWQEEGHTIELAGNETVDGTETIKLKVTLNTGDVTYYYLDSQHYLPIRMVSVRDMQGTPTELTTILGEYKEIDGLMFPFSIEIDTPMGQQALYFQTIEVNVDVYDSVFAMPGG